MDELFVPLNPADFRPIKRILEKDYGGPIETVTPYGRHLWYRSGDPDATELYLKTFPEQIIIARIQLRHTRKGVGSKILAHLRHYAADKGLRTIVAECVNTREMIAFCIKHGFVPDPQKTSEIDGVVYGNYNLDVGAFDTEKERHE